jgi:hypothetical protein
LRRHKLVVSAGNPVLVSPFAGESLPCFAEAPSEAEEQAVSQASGMVAQCPFKTAQCIREAELPSKLVLPFKHLCHDLYQFGEFRLSQAVAQT